MSNQQIKLDKRKISSLILTIFILSIITGSIFSAIGKNPDIDSPSVNQNSQTMVQPQADEFGSHLKYAPAGIYLYSPDFVQLRQGQDEISEFKVRAVDTDNWDLYRGDEWNSPFEKYEIYKDGSLWSEQYYRFSEIRIDLTSFDDLVGIYDLTIKAWHTPSMQWISKHVTVETVASDAPCLTPYYTNFAIDTNFNPNLEWQVSNQGPYNYYFFIDSVEVISQTNVPKSENISIYTGSYGQLGVIGNHEISLVVEYVASSHTTTNTFWVHTKTNQMPYIYDYQEPNNDYYNDPCGYNFWENYQYEFSIGGNQAGQVRLSAKSNDDTAWYKPFEMLNFSEDQRFEFQITPEDVGYNPNEPWMNNFQIRAMPVDANGLVEIDNLPNYDSWYNADQGGGQIVHLNIPIEPTRSLNATTLSDDVINWDNDYKEIVGQVEYNFYFVIDSTNETALDFYGVGGQAFSQHFNNFYPRQADNFDEYDDNRRADDTKTLFEEKAFNGDANYPAGVVFVVEFQNPDAVELPITIKLTYPEVIEPDTTIGEPPLRFLRWNLDCAVENSRGFWVVEDSTKNKTVSATTVELYISESGVYAFGADFADYYTNEQRPPFIPGYPLWVILPAVGIASVLLVRKIKVKRD